MLEFLVGVGLFTIFVVVVAIVLIRLFFDVFVNKAIFFTICVLVLIADFCIDWGDASFFTILLGWMCGLFISRWIVIRFVEICPKCGSWNEFEEIEKLNERSSKELANRRAERKIYDTDHNVIGTFDGERECVERNYYSYDSVRRCKKCGEKKIVHITGSFDSEL